MKKPSKKKLYAHVEGGQWKVAYISGNEVTLYEIETGEDGTFSLENFWNYFKEIFPTAI